MMVPVGTLVVLRGTAKKDLLRATAYLVWPGLLAPVLAPVLGGALTTFLSWHWIFLINFPLGLAAFLAALRLVPGTPGDRTRRLDWLGLALVAAVFVGNIGIKPATTPLILRFGFKPVLVLASLASAATFALCALLDAGTPEPLIFALLVASGAFRSIGFSADASVQYADVVPAPLPSANAVSATLVQFATAAGIAIGALLIRFCEASGPLLGGPGPAAGDAAAPYRAAFLVLAVVMLLSTLDSLTLPRRRRGQPAWPSTSGSTAPAPASLRARPATVTVQRLSTRSSISITLWPWIPARAASSSGPTTRRSQTPASR